MIHSGAVSEVSIERVVNCFQFINFVNDSQWTSAMPSYRAGCELLSVH